MESQSRSEARASLQVDFKVLSRAHVSLQVDFKVLSEAHASLQVNFKVLSVAHASRRSTSKFDPGSAEPQTDFDGRIEKQTRRQIHARIQPDYIFATSARLVARFPAARIAPSRSAKAKPCVTTAKSCLHEATRCIPTAKSCLPEATLYLQ